MNSYMLMRRCLLVLKPWTGFTKYLGQKSILSWDKQEGTFSKIDKQYIMARVYFLKLYKLSIIVMYNNHSFLNIIKNMILRLFNKVFYWQGKIFSRMQDLNQVAEVKNHKNRWMTHVLITLYSPNLMGKMVQLW